MKGKVKLTYLLTIFIIFTLTFLLPLTPRAQVIEEWMIRYNGTGNAEDEANAIAVDMWGNVYVTGYSYGTRTTGFDFITMKYDSNGRRIWANRYSGKGNGHDVPTAIAVDMWGNVYVTGYSWGIGTDYDYVTVKYDSNGSRIWTRRYNGPGNRYDEAEAIAVDIWGNVYVTGSAYVGSGFTFCCVTIKYSPDGTLLWAKQYTDMGNASCSATAIAVDVWGNIYVTGDSRDFGTGNYDYVTLKYDSYGRQIWARRYNGTGNGYDVARAIAVDKWGNIFVTGQSYSSGTGYDYATVKYNSNGRQIWAKRYNGSGNYGDSVQAITIDRSGNIYVTGQSYSSGTGYDYATVKYNSNGRQIWAKRYNGTGSTVDGANAVAVDESGNVYVTGNSDGDYATVKYASDGRQLWVKRYNNGSGNAIAVDIWGNVYVTGELSSNYFTVKYSQ